jgi:micrococcal nuclease
MDVLDACNSKNTKKFCIIGRYRAKCIETYDGDTITVAFSPFGTDIYAFKVRMLHYNSAEIKSKNPDEKAQAIVARDYLRSLILNKIIEIDINGSDKYGRLLGDVICNGCNINQLMLHEGYGKPYDGTGPKEY